MAVIVPLTDKENARAATAIEALKTQLSLLGGLSGALRVETRQANGGQIVSVHGKALEVILPDGFQFTLTGDNLLVLATSDSLIPLLTVLGRGGQNVAVTAIAQSPPGPLDKFPYVYIDPSIQNADLTALFGAQIKRQALYLNIVLRTK
jgi:hypothetical protein